IGLFVLPISRTGADQRPPVLRSELQRRRARAVGRPLADRLPPPLDLDSEANPRGITESLWFGVLRTRQVGDGGKPQVPAFVKFRRLSQTPDVAHGAANPVFDIDRHVRFRSAFPQGHS